jgi:hypothetical protein
MKKFSLFLLTLLTVAATNSLTTFAQKAATPQITINAKGWLVSPTGVKLGYIDKNDVVRDNTGHGLCSVDMTGAVTTASGQALGTAKKNGTYVGPKGESLVTTKDVGKDQLTILDAKGNTLGTVHKSYKQHAYAAHYWLTAAH